MTTNSNPDDEYRATKAEPLPNDPMCLQCGKTVDAWVITFELTIHDDTGYSKLHRCPHCNALSFDDQYFNSGCLVFWISFFPMCGISFWLMTLLTGEIKVGDDGVQGTDALRAGITLIVGGAGTWCCMAMIGSIQKWSLRRKIQKRIADSD
ncbi:MAG: hypothetical protein MK102_17905 [Fuerstiella sp.]|nr:hypothetical protein [Fuerstiella sp.]